MVPVEKFFIYGGGRWREVDTGTGRIDGWGRAKFVIARGGKLEAARSRPVLAALRALAEKKPSSAKEGVQLQQKYPLKHASRGREPAVGCERCQCCHHANTGSSCASKPTEKKSSIAIQCDKINNEKTTTEVQKTIPSARDQETSAQAKTNQTSLPRATNKRNRDSTSSEDLFHTKVITVAAVHSPRKPDPKRRRISSNKSPQKVLRNQQSSTSSEDSQAATKKSLKRPSLKLRRPGPLKRKRTNSSRDTSPILASKKSYEQRHDKISKYLQPKSKKARRDETSSNESVPRQTTRQNLSIVISSDESDLNAILKRRRQKIISTDIPKNKLGLKKPVERSSTNEPKHKAGPKRATESTSTESSSDKSAKHMPSLKRDPKLGYKKIESSSMDEPKSQNKKNGLQSAHQQVTSKELLIDENDVDILRLFLQKHYPDEVLLRFDTDNEYKKMHFYQINPLVNVERCPRIAKIIAHNKDDQLSLVDFASKLGLRSVSEASSVKPKRYKTRRRAEKSYLVDSDRSDSKDTATDVEDKENINRPLANRLKDAKVLRDSLKRNKPGVVKGDRESDKSDRDKTKDTVELSSESETGQKINGLRTEVNKLQAKKRQPKAVISMKRPALKEYSNLEDHAIVSWVSVGGRASIVNGNRLWRQLQEQFQRLTGHGRTWHSLRNRYLRYILPRLHTLALPLTQQARLRAAAATGELKARRREPRRNSIFKLPPRGASSRRPPAARGDTSEDEETKEQGKPDAPNQVKDNSGSPPGPRYSDVTRQFARRHRALQRPSDRATPSPHHTAPPSHSGRRTPDPDDRSPKNSRKQSPSRTNSRSESSKRRSNRTNLPRESRGRKSSRTNLPRESRGRKSSRTNLPRESRRRKSSRTNLPRESRSRNSSRTYLPRESRSRNSSRTNLPLESRKRKSSRTNSLSESSRSKSVSRSPRKPDRRRSGDSGSDDFSSESSASSESISPSESHRRRSNRLKSPSESKKLSSVGEPSRRYPNRANSPDGPNRRYPSRTNSPSETNKRKSIGKNQSESVRNHSPKRRSNRHKSPELTNKTVVESKHKSNNDSSPNRLLRSETSPVKHRTRKLFNPRVVM